MTKMKHWKHHRQQLIQEHFHDLINYPGIVQGIYPEDEPWKDFLNEKNTGKSSELNDTHNSTLIVKCSKLQHMMHKYHKQK